MTKREQARQERAAMDAKRPRIAAASAEAARLRAAHDREVGQLKARQESLRHEWATAEPSDRQRVEKELNEVDLRLASEPAERARIDALNEAALTARRGLEVAYRQHLRDNLATFALDARKASAEVELELRQVIAALKPLRERWELCEGEWKPLLVPLKESRRERDERWGYHRDDEYYDAAGRMPQFPISPAALAAVCRPPAADLLDKAPELDRPAQMRRVA